MRHERSVDEEEPTVDEWYRTLVAMSRRPPQEERLIEGLGNFGVALPAFTACRLTARGRRAAKVLFAKYPQYR